MVSETIPACCPRCLSCLSPLGFPPPSPKTQSCLLFPTRFFFLITVRPLSGEWCTWCIPSRNLKLVFFCVCALWIPTLCLSAGAIPHRLWDHSYSSPEIPDMRFVLHVSWRQQPSARPVKTVQRNVWDEIINRVFLLNEVFVKMNERWEKQRSFLFTTVQKLVSSGKIPCV